MKSSGFRRRPGGGDHSPPGRAAFTEPWRDNIEMSKNKHAGSGTKSKHQTAARKITTGNQSPAVATRAATAAMRSGTQGV